MKLDRRSSAVGLRERRRENETLRIVRVALALFLERGPDQVTAEEIAEAAAISRRTFFRYFPSKDDVLVMVHGRSMRQVAEALVDYWDLGVTTFLVRGFNPLDDNLEYGRTLLPLTKQLIAERMAGKAAAE